MIETTPVAVEAVRIAGADGLDPIHVFWHNVEPGKGYATVICYGCAWTTYFGAMSGRTIQQFFAEADADYLVVKMGAPHLKQGKRHDAYLGRIVKAIQESLRRSA
jgi:hypothetical protein